MKGRFSTLDIVAILPELRDKICGWRVNQVYDCDSKTYLFKLNKSLIHMKTDSDPVTEEEENANKMFFIIESGLRMHTTDYDWPKAHTPNGFALKLRKHLKNKRIESINQIGIDRLVDIQFGSSHAAYHLIVELYDRGNLILTDCDYTILNILRWRKPLYIKDEDQQINSQNDKINEYTDGTSMKEKADSENLKVGQIYPLTISRKEEDLEALNIDKITEILTNSTSVMENRKNRGKIKVKKDSKVQEISLKDLLNPRVIYGAGLLEDSLVNHLGDYIDGRKCSISIPIMEDGRLSPERVKMIAKEVHEALESAEAKFKLVKESKSSPGYIVQKKQQSQLNNNDDHSNITSKNKVIPNESNSKEYLTNIDFYPIKSCVDLKIKEDPVNLTYQEFESFDKAVDIYFCNMESQKIDSRALHAEKDAKKRLEKVKLDQQKRLDSLAKTQKEDEEKARLIEYNCDKVENALLVIRSLIACQTSWTDIWDTIKEAKAKKDPVACLITGVNFDRNEFTMCLENPFDDFSSNNSDDDESSEDSNDNDDGNTGKQRSKNQKKKQTKPGKDHKSKHSKLVDIDISISAFANARRYFDKRRFAVKKEQKTIDVSAKVFKNVERKAREMLKEVVIKSNITKARKRYWFENFFWFISSDGYLVVAGRDAEQNELLVKRYMKNNDIYVHADLHGASSVIVKNISNTEPVPPKTLTEAGTMAVCYSSAWEAKIATTSWWVYPNQVSKTAPAGEYLTLGAFIIRGKKNYLPLSTLVLGFGFLFRLEEESIEKRFKDRLKREALQIKEKTESDDSRQRTTTEVSEDNSEAYEITLLEPTDEKHHLDNSDYNKADDFGNDDDEDDNDNDYGFDEKAKQVHYVEDEDNIELAKNDDQEDHDLDNEDDDDELDETKKGNREHRLVDTLTGAPNQDDILSYAIPVCGPYSALQSYKFKVKVITGTNKRGKAAKTCLNVFLFDKNATQRERDLLKSCKDQDFARNIPNKCKISAVNLKTIQKKKTKKSEVRFHNHQSIS